MNLGNYVFDDFVDVEGLPVLVKLLGVPNYDYNFRTVFKCKSICEPPQRPVLLRVGAIDSYENLQATLMEIGVQLLFTAEQHERASTLEKWYPLISKFTPFSVVYEHFPSVSEVKRYFHFPIFIKGSRQTNKHQKKLSIIPNETALEKLSEKWTSDSILSWQKVVVREFIDLQVVDSESFPDSVPFCYEFRAFYWMNKFVGMAKYWYLGNDYSISLKDKDEVISLGNTIANIIDVPFISIDFAKTNEGKWIVIEINDGQESGYVGNAPLSIWQNIIEHEKLIDHVK